MQLSLNHNANVVYHSSQRVLVVWSEVALKLDLQNWKVKKFFSDLRSITKLICTEKSFRIFFSIWWTWKEMQLFIYLLEILLFVFIAIPARVCTLFSKIERFSHVSPLAPSLIAFHFYKWLKSEWNVIARVFISTFAGKSSSNTSDDEFFRWDWKMCDGLPRKSFITERWSWKLTRDHRCH